MTDHTTKIMIQMIFDKLGCDRGELNKSLNDILKLEFDQMMHDTAQQKLEKEAFPFKHRMNAEVID